MLILYESQNLGEIDEMLRVQNSDPFVNGYNHNQIRSELAIEEKLKKIYILYIWRNV